MNTGENCPKCRNKTLEMGYGLMGGGIGAYEYCTTEGCDHFENWPDPELSTPEELQAHCKKERTDG